MGKLMKPLASEVEVLQCEVSYGAGEECKR